MSELKKRIKQWWTDAPMTYAHDHGDTLFQHRNGVMEQVEMGTRRFYELSDDVFYSWNEPLHLNGRKFGKLFPYDRYVDRRVLEVGCGMGCMAMNWAQNAAHIYAVDMNPTAVDMTRKRFNLYNLDGRVTLSDGEVLPFRDNAFDYIYSWGVLHHTPGIRKALQEIYRVATPGAEIGVMLYNRRSFLYGYQMYFLDGIVNMERHFLNDLEFASRYGDGGRQDGNPHTWPVTKEEVVRDLFVCYDEVRTALLGTDLSSTFWHWYPDWFAKCIPKCIYKALARRWGWSLWITAKKPI